MAAQSKCWTCNSEAQSSIPTLDHKVDLFSVVPSSYLSDSPVIVLVTLFILPLY